MEEKTVARAYTNLEDKYMNKSLTTKQQLMQCLYVIRKSEGILLNSQLVEFSSIITYLSKTDLKIEDNDQVLFLLCSFLSSYKNFKDTLINGRGELFFEEVK